MFLEVFDHGQQVLGLKNILKIYVCFESIPPFFSIIRQAMKRFEFAKNHEIGKQTHKLSKQKFKMTIIKIKVFTKRCDFLDNSHKRSFPCHKYWI
jgi:hypothetical protein